MTTLNIEDKFKLQLIEFLDELIELWPKEPSFVEHRISVSTNQIDSKDIITTFIHSINTNDKQNLNRIKNRDHSVFTETNLFDFFKETPFVKLWGTIDESNQNTLWQWIESFLHLSNMY